ncbi:SH3 domain-containing kinase-binding protein 1 [Antennarius striatus]|uniref:SH3 domain-containing kinase-binding protein 1 n=1 Tax=Antennarius striatus TaxID=241820 RepID=UPI0035B2148F
MEGVVLPQVLLDVTSDAGPTRCKLKGSAGFSVCPSTLVLLCVVMGSYSSALVPETEEFHSIVSIAEKLNEQMTVMMEDETKENSREEQTPPTFEDDSSQNETDSPKEEPDNVSGQSLSSLLPKVLSAVMPQSLSANAEADSDPIKPNPPNLERLQTELRDLKGQFDKMKSQHNKEIKLLMNELDEEKKIRLTLQMEIQRLKKHMSK